MPRVSLASLDQVTQISVDHSSAGSSTKTMYATTGVIRAPSHNSIVCCRCGTDRKPGNCLRRGLHARVCRCGRFHGNQETPFSYSCGYECNLAGATMQTMSWRKNWSLQMWENRLNLAKAFNEYFGKYTMEEWHAASRFNRISGNITFSGIRKEVT